MSTRCLHRTQPAGQQRGGPWCVLLASPPAPLASPAQTPRPVRTHRRAHTRLAVVRDGQDAPPAVQVAQDSQGSSQPDQPSAPSSLSVQVISWLSHRRLAERCINTIARALADDVSSAYYCQPGRAEQFYRGALNVTLKSNPFAFQILTVDNGACAAVCATLPGPEVLYAWGAVTAIPDLITVATSLQPSRWSDAMRSSDLLDASRTDFVKERQGPVLYVFTVGTDPSRQGQGLGSELMKVLTEFADRQQMVCYLEASDPRNVIFYERHGFSARGTQTPRPGAPVFTLMSRPPRASQGTGLSSAPSLQADNTTAATRASSTPQPPCSTRAMTPTSSTAVQEPAATNPFDDTDPAYPSMISTEGSYSRPRSSTEGARQDGSQYVAMSTQALVGSEPDSLQASSESMSSGKDVSSQDRSESAESSDGRSVVAGEAGVYESVGVRGMGGGLFQPMQRRPSKQRQSD